MLAPIMNKSLDDQEKFYRQTNDDDVFDCVHCIMGEVKPSQYHDLASIIKWIPRQNWLLPLERRVGDQASLNQLLVQFLVSLTMVTDITIAFLLTNIKCSSLKLNFRKFWSLSYCSLPGCFFKREQQVRLQWQSLYLFIKLMSAVKLLQPISICSVKVQLM